MTGKATAAAVRLAATGVVLALGVSGCKLLAVGQQTPVSRVRPSPAKPSLLIVITDSGSQLAVAGMSALLASTGRAGEHLFILDGRTGTLLVSSTVPSLGGTDIAGPPPPLPPGATSFQMSRHEQAMTRYREARSAALSRLERERRDLLIRWSRTSAFRAAAGLRSTSGHHGSVTGALSAAAADSASLSQAGVDYGNHETIAILGSVQLSSLNAAELPAAPSGATVVISDFRGDAAAQAAWQAALLQAGAARAVILSPAVHDQLGDVVREGLDGAITDTLSDVLFGVNQDRLRPAAGPQLHRLLWLLRIRYPLAIASIDGYTDSLPAPGGNLALSLHRAEAVESWLVTHGVRAGRLQVAGYGAADPVAPNTSYGQPLNRRVVVVIDPAA